jgi:parallel beta-helix repeat protein
VHFRTVYLRPQNRCEALEPRRFLSTYIVSPTGSDDSAGTADAPFATLQQAAKTVKAGDTVQVRAGNYSGFAFGWDQKIETTEKSPIKFLADPGTLITSRNNKTPDGINVENSSHIILEGFTFEPKADDDAWRSAIRFGGGGAGNIARHNTIKARPTDKYGIFSSFTTDLLIEANTVSGTNNSGIYTSNSAVRPTLTGNTVTDAERNGIHFNGDISQGGTGIITGATIKGNTVTNTGKSGGSAINCDGLQNSTIANNTLNNNHAKGIALYQIDAAAGSKSNRVEGNTVIMAPAPRGAALLLKNASPNNTILKNAFSSSEGALVVSADSLEGLTSDHNTFAGKFSVDGDDSRVSFAQWQRVTKQDAHSIATDNTPTSKRAAAIAIGLIGFAIFAILIVPFLYILHRRNLHTWIHSYYRSAAKRRAPRNDEHIHALICIADHFEPGNNKVPAHVADARVKRWCIDYPNLFSRFQDSSGRPPQHTFFYPLEQYTESHVAQLADLCRQGYGEVELHLHHDNDISDNLRAQLEGYKKLIHSKHNLLPRDRTGVIKYAFVHGNWALDNSHPLGRWCGVNDELTILRETGCYADFTMPAAPDPCQIAKINSIYYAIDNPQKPCSHNTGIDVGTAPQPRDSIMLIQGPLLLDWRNRKIENACIQGSQPPTMHRLDLWLKARVHVPTRPDWLFIKLHTHGCADDNTNILLGPPMTQFHHDLAQRAKDNPNFHYHYVTARQMYNLAKAAEAGFNGSVAKALDYELTWPSQRAHQSQTESPRHSFVH